MRLLGRGFRPVHGRGVASGPKGRNGAGSWGLRVAVLELERRALEVVREAPVGDADAGGGVAGVQDGDRLGTAALRECRVRRDGGPAAFGDGGSFVAVAQGDAE